MRLFIAVKIDNDKLNQFAELIQKEINDELRTKLKTQQLLDFIRVRIVNEYHITLKFLGEMKEKQYSDLLSVFIHMKGDKFSLSLDKLSVFHNYRKDKANSVIYLGFTESLDMSDLVQNVNNEIEAAFGKNRHDRDKNRNNFVSHITLMRVRYNLDLMKHPKKIKSIIDEIIEKINLKYKEYFSYHIFDVKKMELLESVQTRNGVKYKTLSKNYL